MYIVAIAWIYVTLLMALTESSFVAGLATFLFYGLFPLALLLWLLGTPERRRRRLRAAAAAQASAEVDPESADSDPAAAEVGPPASGLDPGERGHPAARRSPTIGPESTGIIEGAQSPAADALDPRDR